MPTYEFYTNNFNCPCGYSFNQRSGDSLRKYNMVKRLHQKKCDQYVETPVVVDRNTKSRGKSGLKELASNQQKCEKGEAE